MKDGSYYKGKFFNGELEGEGEIFLAMTNYKFKGHFKKGLKQGKGKIEKENYTYDGHFS